MEIFPILKILEQVVIRSMRGHELRGVKNIAKILKSLNSREIRINMFY